MRHTWHNMLAARRGTTMVEVLVVIAVLSLLLGLLLPALASVSAGSRSLRCQSNMRQMATAAQNYSAIFDCYPVALRFEQRQGVMHRVAWDWVTTFSNQLVSPGPLWQFTDSPGEVQQCPEFEGASTFGGDPFTGYNYNTTYVAGEAPFPLTGWEAVRSGVKPHACSRSSQCAVFGDGGWRGGANKFMRAPLNSEGLSPGVIYGGGQAFRHVGATNVAYLDGHIGACHQPRPGPSNAANLLVQTLDFPRNGFLSDDDSAYRPR